jgi:aryl-alcohol dehydrogenase-like predicted oxidoreductase
MQYRQLGSTGLRVSTVGLGTNNFGFRMDEESSLRVAKFAVDQGINFFDTANSYGRGLSEERIGKALVGIRKDVIIATKVGNPMGDGPNDKGASRHHIMQQVEDSLRLLQTDYIDLYQIHRPDANTPIEETLRALDDLVRQGKVRYIGGSNYNGWQTAEAVLTSNALGLAQFVTMQPEYNMLNRSIETELLPFCDKYNIGILPFYPLASGFLTGKYLQGQEAPEGTRLAGNERAQQNTLTDKNFRILSGLSKFAEDSGHPMVELAIAWLLARPAVSSVIAGATKEEQITANVKASDWDLTESEMEELDTLLKIGD